METTKTEQLLANKFMGAIRRLLTKLAAWSAEHPVKTFLRPKNQRSRQYQIKYTFSIDTTAIVFQTKGDSITKSFTRYATTELSDYLSNNC